MKDKIIYGLLSVVIAFGLWLYVVTVISPESEATFYNVPVVLENESVLKENGLMVDEEKDFFVTLVLSGNRSDLNRLKSSDIMVVANLGRISKAGPQTLPYDISIPGGNNSITVISSSPETVTVNIAEWSTKEVDIKLKPVGAVPKDYIVDERNSELNHNTVTITGPKDVLDRIAMATVEVDVTGQTQTISQKYRLTFCDAENQPVDVSKVTASIAEVNATVRILLVKEINLIVNTLNASTVGSSNVKITVQPQSTIKVAGSERLLAELESLQLGTIDLAEIMEASATYKFPVKLPEGVRNYSGFSEVIVTVQFEGMATKTLTVTNVTEKGTTPEGMEAKLPIQWEVTLRGDEALIAQIQPEDLTISVDLTDAELGEDLYTPTVEFTEEFKNVDVIHIEDVSVTLTEVTGKTVTS